jgi:uracil-DNA glycosylase
MRIYDEIKKNYPDYDLPLHGDISSWSSKGILLLHSSLTSSLSEKNKFNFVWLSIISKIFQAIAEKRKNCIYLLWGDKAKDYVSYIPKTSIILTANHPNNWYLSTNIHCDHFRKVNDLLLSWKEDPINWNLDF